MPRGSHRSSVSASADAELLLPRPPGVIRQFWARHPLLTDILVTLIGLLIAVATAVSDWGWSGGVRVVEVVATVIAVAAAGSLMLRRRWPLIPFILAIVMLITLLGSPSAAGSPFLTIPMYAVAVYGSSRLCWIAYGVGTGAIALAGLVGLATTAVTLQNAINGLISAAVAGLIGALVGINVGNRKRYLEAVIDRSRQLVVERDQQAQLAAADERARIAREMHDVVSHSLTVIVALAEGASATPDIERARGAMDAAAGAAREALTEMRTMLGVLRDGDQDAPLAPLAPVSPHDVVAAAQRAGYPATLVVTGSADLPESTRYAVGRIVQEGVTNAMRHAPSATSIRVLLHEDADATTITVRNDGAEPATGPGGFGLRGLAERVAHIGGTFAAGPDGHGGWELTATLPMPEADPLTEIEEPQ
ncbi:hypothetical protein LK09_19765 [Microbacterium mangrovi]|uniref:histidine kinase n=1 Tax=Microbacterium mangrovi TaxID=1348253 RepID=A0A0B2A0M9_9MICO|nr:histidine kinase [Microbacterium mangrovi]KHK95150.1 hypothetical protein LK09_19765 [Microbacterium mangrovi]